MLAAGRRVARIGGTRISVVATNGRVDAGSVGCVARIGCACVVVVAGFVSVGTACRSRARVDGARDAVVAVYRHRIARSSGGIAVFICALVAIVATDVCVNAPS